MDNTILITGASSGVGASLTKLYAEKGFQVIAAARRVERIAENFEKYDNVKPLYLDLADISNLPFTIDNLLHRYTCIPFLINNAGVNISGNVEELNDDDIMRSLYVNALAPVKICKMLLPAMVQNNFGRIINLTSGAPLNCFPGYSAYSASKGTLNAFSVTMAREYEDHNIKINLMSPGPVKTEMAPKAPMDVSVCHPTVEYLLNIDETGPTGKFFWLGYEVPMFPDLEGVQWLEGKGNEKLIKVLE